MRVRVVSRPELAAGFELAGLAVVRADDGAAAEAALARWSTDAEVGIVLVDDGLYRAMAPDVLMRFERQGLPVIAPVPAPHWDEPSEAEAYIVDILRQAIGYRVRLR